MTSSDPSSERPADHRLLISAMQESAPKPSGKEIPDIPSELLRKLQQQYGPAPGSVVDPVVPEEMPEKAPPPPTIPLQGRIIRFLTSPKIAIAAGLLLLGLISVRWSLHEKEEDLLRGNDPPRTTWTSYWASNTTPPPAGARLPAFIILDPTAPAPPNAIILDPAQRTARLTGPDGQAQVTITITDPGDSEEWRTAHRQLEKTPPAAP